MFSPYYARARRKGNSDPLDHVSVNAILYAPKTKRWAMTERRANTVERSETRYAVGASSLEWRGDRLVITIDEWTVPIPRRLRGRITLHAETLFDDWHAIDAAGRHRWRPIMPMARAEVEFDKPDLCWKGGAYCDTNRGAVALERDFRSWNWSRTGGREAARVLYETEGRDGSARNLALEYRADGSIAPFEPPPLRVLPRTGWRVARATRSDTPARVLRTLEDTPFYTRSTIASSLGGFEGVSIHESVDLGRFANPIVQAMLPFKMPRRFW